MTPIEPATQKILLVEDNSDDEFLTVRALQRSNITNQIVVMRDGQEAYDYLYGNGNGEPLSHAELPALVLLDLKLPRLSGLEFLRRMRGEERTRHLPVVVLTSSDEERDLSASYDLGANSFVNKPVDFQEFSEAVRQLGLYWLLINRRPVV